MESRIDRLEDRLVVGEERQQWLREMTIAANMRNVPNVILYEAILSTLEAALFPDEPSRRPKFVDEELLRPVSTEEIRLVVDEERRSRETDEVSPEEIVRIMDEGAESARRKWENKDFFPIGLNHPKWDIEAFLERWERVREKIVDNDIND